MALKWTEIEPAVSTQIGLEAQINDASGGNRIGTYSWYDETGTGWSSPSVFGTAVLVDVDCKHENVELRNDVEATCTTEGYVETFIVKIVILKYPQVLFLKL